MTPLATDCGERYSSKFAEMVDFVHVSKEMVSILQTATNFNEPVIRSNNTKCARIKRRGSNYTVID